jgi:MFS family permease
VSTTRPLIFRNRNYRLLFAAGALTNLGDGMVALALPWLASLMTRDPLAIAAVAAAGRLPWLLFSIPAGVVIDRGDRRRLIARADLFRAGLILAILALALNPAAPGGAWALAGLAFLLGAAEVLRDNAAQTIMPALVDSADLETANGQLWSAETLAGQFIGPPLAGVLIAASIALPFALDAGALLLAAGLVWLIALQPHLPNPQPFLKALREGAAHMRADAPLLRLAVVLGLVNFLFSATLTVQILFAQELLGLSAAGYGLILSVEACGAILGSLAAPALVRWLGLGLCLQGAIALWALCLGVAGLATQAPLMAVMLFAAQVGSMVWNVITVSWRQRRIPPALLGRVNSIYRFFGWGSMPLGALAGGLTVTLLEPPLGREAALRAPFLLAALGCGAILVYAVLRLKLETTEA